MQSAHLMRDPISNHSDAISHTHLLDRAPIAYQIVQGAFEVLEDHLRRPLRIPNQSQCGRMGERRGQPCLVLELRSQLVGAPLGLLELLHSDLLAPEQPAKHLLQHARGYRRQSEVIIRGNHGANQRSSSEAITTPSHQRQSRRYSRRYSGR